MTEGIAIDGMRSRDWAEVREVYREGLATGLAAFMRDPPSWKTWDRGHLAVGRLVARDGASGIGDGAVLGWSALAPVPDT